MFIDFSPLQIQRGLVGFAALVALGVLVHDTKLDQAAALALTLPVGLAVMSQVSLHSEGHTHIEHGNYGKTTVMGMPRVQPRDDHRKYLLTKRLGGFNAPEPHTLVVDPQLV